MCGICGCSSEHTDHHQHDGMSHHVAIEQGIFENNNQFAEKNRRNLKEKKVLALNLMSSPGSGKTTLLAKTITALQHTHTLAVIVGDQQTDHDAALITSAGGHAIQINTGKSCHLDAHAVGHAMEDLGIHAESIMFIENVGNLVCPAAFDLGENNRVVLLSVTEGENKPLKYPDMFKGADVLLLTKTDLLPYVDFDVEQCLDYAKRVAPNIRMIPLSSKTGDGLSEWYQWIKQKQMEL